MDFPDRDMNTTPYTMSQDNVSVFRQFDDTHFHSPTPHARPAAAFLGLPENSGLERGEGPQTPNNTVVEPLVVDTLANDFKLDQQQRVNLHAFVKLGSISPPLSRADLLTRLYSLAVIFSHEAERNRMAAQQGVAGDLKGLLADLKIRLEETFTFTVEQRANIRGAVQDVIYQASRTSFTTMHVDVEGYLSKERTAMKLVNVFGSPAREKRLASLIKKTCSSVRNAFRQDLRDSISPASVQSLAEFTYDSAMKYKRGGYGEGLDHGFTIHNVILRKFVFDNPNLVGTPEESEAENDGPEDNDGAQVKKKRKRAVGGRIPKGEDFWGRVDAFFASEIAKRGRNLTGSHWKEYVNDLIRFDNARFGKASDQDSFFNTASSSPVNSTGAIFGGGPGQNGNGPSHSVSSTHGAGPQQPAAQGAGLFNNLL